MSSASTEVPNNFREADGVDVGGHVGYVFESSADKQVKLFAICRDAVDLKNCGVLYVAGKQGVKGIRLSLIDTRFDVSSYSKSGQMEIVDSEEWFLENERSPKFRSLEDLSRKFTEASARTEAAGYNCLVVISETDMLVRKGFLAKYLEFDEHLGRTIKDMRIAFVCAFDKRELLAAGIKDPASKVSESHSIML